jgi:hypothetical protein
MEGGERRAPFKKVTLFYVGKLPPPRRIGLLRTIKNIGHGYFDSKKPML